MITLTAKDFAKLRKNMLAVKTNDQVSLDSIREELVNKAPDANALKLCKLFNSTVEKKLESYKKDYIIDLTHVENLIKLRKVSIYLQSVIIDCQQLATNKPYLHQIDLSLLNEAKEIVEQEKNVKKRNFYIDYYNYDILSHLIAIEPNFASELIESERPISPLTKLEEKEAKPLVH